MDNPADVYAVHVELLGLLNSLFELWLGFSFATIVAFHLAAARINAWILSGGVLLYILSSYIFIVRYIHTLQVIGFLNRKLADSGIDPYPVPELPHPVSTIMIVGSVATVAYSVYAFSKADRSA